MSKSTSNPFLFVGKQIKDEYGRQIGRVASFKVTPTGRIDGIFVEHGDGEFLTYANDQIKIDNGELEPMVQDSPEYLELVRQTATETINRHLRDWERYEKIYSIFRSDIYSEDVHQVSTANTPPEKVVATILDILKT